ncbi:hypothetical protein PV797_15070 [Clostridiaceae bacterium M8S5]|nr:hypothetical protein PV797_15070 [Clostridiaceae bacterium M8S5]
MTEEINVNCDECSGISTNLLFFFLLLVILMKDYGWFDPGNESLLFFFLILVILFCQMYY